MKTRCGFVVVACLTLVGVPRLAWAQNDHANDHANIRARAKASELVVVGTIVGVDPQFETNEFGDQLIVSKVQLRVDEKMKGNADPVVPVSIEGGTVGDLKLDVSDLPTVKQGDRGTFFLDKSRDGTFVPHDRGFGIMKLDARDRVEDSDLTLDEIRTAVKEAR
jgi:hypothetical protein